MTIQTEALSQGPVHPRRPAGISRLIPGPKRLTLRSMTIDTAPFRVREDETIKLKHRPTRVDPFYRSEEEYETRLTEQTHALDALQQRLYAADTHAMLLIFQAMDAAGKDGVIRNVMSGINPQGCQVFSYKHPSPQELDHDFLWRCTRDLPERGRIGIFNRSYYEEVLIVRVHPEILQAEKLPKVPDDLSKVWDRRYRSIRGLERHLHANGTRIVKFFLHLSREEQRDRFLARIDEPAKNWKFNADDIKERAFWDDYMSAYEHCMRATSTKHAPWHIVPADDKRNARLIVSQIVFDTMTALKSRFPKSSPEHRKELLTIREALLKEKQ